jgi:hypothetical protein
VNFLVNHLETSSIVNVAENYSECTVRRQIWRFADQKSGNYEKNQGNRDCILLRIKVEC